MAKNPPGYSPYSWWEEQDYVELPQMRSESDVAYSTRKSMASLSRAIIISLQSVRLKWDY